MRGTIFIVDDNPENLKILDTILCLDGHKVKTASRGDIALQAIAAMPPDLILLDILMPDMDGFEICRRLKENPSTADIPVLFISALADPGEKLRAFEEGALDYITRPFVKREVSARIRTHLGLAAAQKQLLQANRELAREVEARRLAEEQYRIIFEHSKDAILISDPAGRLIDANQAGIELFGYAKEELFSLDPALLYSKAEDRKRLWQKLYRTGFIDEYELEMKRKDGETIIVHLSVSVLKDDEGKVFGHRGIFRDMTERKKLERQLLQSQKMESIGLLAGGVAHDFNNLLTAISGYGQLLKDRIPAGDAEAQDNIQQVLKAAGRAAELTRSLLAFSRKQVINPKPVYVNAIIGNTARLIQRIIGEDIEFNTSFSGGDLPVMADAGQFEQVLMNLATNARDAMPCGGRLSISLTEVFVREGAEALYDLSSPGRYALISVADTGSGIDNESMERLFEPFYTTKEIGKGTGLGLSIVYGIIKQHNGAVLVGSQPGKGTTFNIYLPLIDGPVSEENTALTPVVTGGDETVLIAEDEEIVKDYLKKILEKAGYRVIVAGDGEEAVALFRERDDITLVLSDVVMPKKNGREILEEIRKIKPDIRIIFISGYTASIMHNRGIIDEGVDFIAKPFSKNQVLQKIREVMDNR